MAQDPLNKDFTSYFFKPLEVLDDIFNVLLAWVVFWASYFLHRALIIGEYNYLTVGGPELYRKV